MTVVAVSAKSPTCRPDPVTAEPSCRVAGLACAVLRPCLARFAIAGCRASPERIALSATQLRAACCPQSRLDRSPIAGRRWYRAGQRRSRVARSCRPDSDRHRYSDRPASDARGIGQQVEHLVVLDRQAFGYAARFAPGEDQVQVLIRSQRPMGVMAVARCLGKARVVVGDELRHEGVGGFHGADIRYGEGAVP